MSNHQDEGSYDNVHFRAKEFIFRSYHYEPGWYFYDEEGDLYGPFLNKKHCEVGLQLYLQQLIDGVAPTQIDKTKIIGNQN